MADTQIEAAAHNLSHTIDGSWGPYWINQTTAIIICTVDNVTTSDEDLTFFRTTDSGENWSKTIIETTPLTKHLAVWFDQETPGDLGTLLHLAFLTFTPDEVRYRTVDIADGSLGTLRTVDSSITATLAWQNRICITKTKSGNLIVAFETEVDLECYRSDDDGATWTDRADVYETAGQFDFCLLFPANTADDDDACALFWDRSADAISTKMYDESANTWTETAILSSIIDDLFWVNMDGSVLHSNQTILCAVHSDADTATDDLRTFIITPNSISSPGIDTTTANVATDQTGSAQCCVFINQQNDEVYIAYLKGGTWLTAVDVVYHISTDGMSTWGSEQAYSQDTADDLRRVTAGRTLGNGGGLFQPVFFNHDLTDYWINLVNDIPINSLELLQIGSNLTGGLNSTRGGLMT